MRFGTVGTANVRQNARQRRETVVIHFQASEHFKPGRGQTKTSVPILSSVSLRNLLVRCSKERPIISFAIRRNQEGRRACNIARKRGTRR